MHGRRHIAEGTEAPEEFPKVFFTVSYEDIASLKGPADGVSGQLRHLALSNLSISRKCHESVMSLVMVFGSCKCSVSKHTIL